MAKKKKYYYYFSWQFYWTKTSSSKIRKTFSLGVHVSPAARSIDFLHYFAFVARKSREHELTSDHRLCDLEITILSDRDIVMNAVHRSALIWCSQTFWNTPKRKHFQANVLQEIRWSQIYISTVDFMWFILSYIVNFRSFGGFSSCLAHLFDSKK